MHPKCNLSQALFIHVPLQINIHQRITVQNPRQASALVGAVGRPSTRCASCIESFNSRRFYGADLTGLWPMFGSRLLGAVCGGRHTIHKALTPLHPYFALHLLGRVWTTDSPLCAELSIIYCSSYIPRMACTAPLSEDTGGQFSTIRSPSRTIRLLFASRK